MPKKKRAQRHKKSTKNPCNDDIQIRSPKENTSINISPIAHNQIYDVPSSDFSLDYWGLKCLFSPRNNCYSSTLIEAHNKEVLHFDPIQKTPIRITDMFDADLESVQCSFVNNITTPTNRNSAKCMKTFGDQRLKKLKNFNDVIMNTTQGVHYDNAEIFIPIQLTPPKMFNSVENLFFSPQLYDCKLASTPFDVPSSISIGTQTSAPRKTATSSLTKRRSYRASPVLVYAEQFPKLNWQSVNPLQRTREVTTVTTIEMCTRIISKIKTYHGQYASHLPMKIIDLCTWLGFTIKQGLISLYKLYTRQNEASCNCANVNQIAALTRSFESLRAEILKMKDENKENCEQLRNELRKLDENIKRDLDGFRSAPVSIRTVPLPPPPPPPLPPPPPSLPNIPLSITKSEAKQLKKNANEIRQPIVSLDALLNVKLRKTSERPVIRRQTEPILTNSFKKTLKPACTRGQTPTSSTSTSILSDSPVSSLTRLLTGVNVRRVKRLQRSTTCNTLDDFSRSGLQSKREREN